MKRLIIVLVVLGVVVCAAFWPLAKKNRVPASREDGTNATFANAVTQKQSSHAAWVSPVPNDPDPEYTKKFLAMTDIDPSIEWRAPINFFGQVVYEDGQPVIGAGVAFSWNDLSEKGTSQHSTVSDAAGRFELTGRTGKALGVSVSVTDAYPFTNGAYGSFEYGNPLVNRHFPNKNNPVVFRWKRQGVLEPLVTWSASLRPAQVGKKLEFQFLPDGQVVEEGGDIQVSCAVEPEDDNRHYGWAVKVSIPGGGFLKTDEEFPFLAPENGYAETLEWSMKADDPEWKAGTKTEDYYIRFGNPVRYGRVRIGFYANRVKFYKFSNFGLSYWINPSGSRILEVGKGEPPSIPETRLQNRVP